MFNVSGFDGIDTEDDFVGDFPERFIIEFHVGVFRSIGISGLHSSSGVIARLLVSVEEGDDESLSFRGEAEFEEFDLLFREAAISEVVEDVDLIAVRRNARVFEEFLVPVVYTFGEFGLLVIEELRVMLRVGVR